jgi:hypothetical protein
MIRLNLRPSFWESLKVSRLVLAFQAFMRVLFDQSTAERVRLAINPPPPPPPAPVERPKFDLRILALLQRDGRLIDFLMESIDDYDDTQVGAAVRDIHAKCRKSLLDHFKIEPVTTPEGTSATVHIGYDPELYRLVGQVAGSGPWKGQVNHPGWQVVESRIPDVPGAYAEVPVLNPVEVEVR